MFECGAEYGSTGYLIAWPLALWALLLIVCVDCGQHQAGSEPMLNRHPKCAAPVMSDESKHPRMDTECRYWRNKWFVICCCWARFSYVLGPGTDVLLGLRPRLAFWAVQCLAFVFYIGFQFSSWVPSPECLVLEPFLFSVTITESELIYGSGFAYILGKSNVAWFDDVTDKYKVAMFI